MYEVLNGGIDIIACVRITYDIDTNAINSSSDNQKINTIHSCRNEMFHSIVRVKLIRNPNWERSCQSVGTARVLSA